MRPNTSTQSTFTNTHKYENPPQMYTNTSLSTYTSKNKTSKQKSSPNVYQNASGAQMYTNKAGFTDTHKNPKSVTNSGVLFSEFFFSTPGPVNPQKWSF